MALGTGAVVEHAGAARTRPSDIRQHVSELFLLYREHVYRYLAAVLQDRSEAEDLAQEAFLRLFLELQKGGKVSNVRAWLFRVAHNLVADRHRQSRQIVVPAETQVSPEQSLLRSETEGKLKAGLSRLSPQERRCLELRAEGLRYREIAEVLSIRISTAETFLARAVRKIAQELNA